MAYKPCDRIFAKVKGFPHWPARINVLPNDVKVPKGKYPIFFYGTHEVYFLAPKDIFPYERWKHKYAVSRNRPLFQKGLEEIENEPDVLLYGKDADAEQFLSQFYEFKRSAGRGSSSLDEEFVTPSEPPMGHASKKSVSRSSGVCSRRSGTKHIHESGKQVSPDREGRFSKRVTKTEKQSSSVLNDGEKLTTDSAAGERLESPLDSETGEVNRGSTDTISPTNRAPATTALGRPMRKSASKFSAMRLLKAGITFGDDEGSNEDADWHPTAAHNNDASDDYVPPDKSPTSPKSSQHSRDGSYQRGLKKQKDKPKSVTFERLKRPISSSSTEESSTSTDPDRRDNRKRSLVSESQRYKKRRTLPSSLAHRRERSRVRRTSVTRGYPRHSKTSSSAFLN